MNYRVQIADAKARMTILQGLPGFLYVGWLYQKNFVSNRDAYRQIGNAIPPVMFWHIMKSIEYYLEKEKSDELYVKAI